MDRHYTITLVNGTNEGAKNPVAGQNSTPDTEKSKISKESAQAFTAGLVAYRKIKSFAVQVVNHEVSMVQLRTGSNELQERANFINQAVQTGVGVIEGALVGATLGGLPGMVLGTALSAMHKVINIAQNEQRIQTERAIEDVSIQMIHVRSGANGSRRN